MSRRRSLNPTKAISITLPQTLIDQIDDELTRTASRSAWIASACEGKLRDASLHTIDDKTLLVMALERLPRGSVVRDLLYEHITISS